LEWTKVSLNFGLRYCSGNDLEQKPSNNRLGSRSQTSALKGKRPDHNIEQIKTRIRTCAHTQKYKVWATHVMLARASTTSLACAQAPKLLSDAQVGSNSGGGPKKDCWHWDE